jgi:DNA-binding XRE family transcriptional regulator
LLHEAVVFLVVSDTSLSFFEKTKVEIALELASLLAKSLPGSKGFGDVFQDGDEIHWRVSTYKSPAYSEMNQGSMNVYEPGSRTSSQLC